MNHGICIAPIRQPAASPRVEAPVQGPPNRSQPRSIFHAMLREPTTHFVLLALALFVVARLVGSRAEVIEVDRREIEQRIAQVEVARGGSLTLEQRQRVEDEYIYEQVLARRAQSLVRAEDPRIHDILVQTMLHYLRSDVVPPPTQAELRAYYEANRARYARAPAVTLDEFLLRPSGTESGERPAALHDDVSPEEIPAEQLIRHRRLARLAPSDLGRLFDTTIVRTVLEAEAGEWIGPHRSPDGDHWLRVRDKHGGREAPPLEYAIEAVQQDWVAQQEQTRFEAYVAALTEEYVIRFTDGRDRGGRGSGNLDGGAAER